MDITVFIFSILKTLKSSEPAVLCALSHFSHWSPLVLTSGLSIFFKEPLAPLAASFISRVFSSIQPLKSRLFLLTLPLWGLPSRQGSRSREIEVCSVHCRPAERGEEAWLHTPVPLAPGGKLGRGCVCLPTRSQNNFSVEPIRSKTSNSVGI